MREVSFIIPAYNEEKFLPETIRSISANLGSRYDYEIIVVDHGSTDRTATLARSAGATVYVKQHATTISELRNYGVSRCEGEVLVFLDADTTVTADWASYFPSVLAELRTTPKALIGAKREVPTSASWVSRLWFRSRSMGTSPTHFGGGHMIMTRTLFEELGGFSTSHETGEDYEFCVRARQRGVTLIARPQLRALHRGVPASLKQFFLREVWHGRGDWVSLRAIGSSKVAMASILFLLLHAALLVDVVTQMTNFAVTGLAVTGIAALCLVSAAHQYKSEPIWIVLGNSLLFYVYYAARTLSLGDVILRRETRKHVRQT